MRAGGLSRFPDNGLALPSRPSSSQKKKGKAGSFIRKSITITRRKRKQGSPLMEDRMRSLLYAYRAELRPLLDAIRFVESSNRVDCPDGDGGASIGPLQISEHYHLDAWNNRRTHSWLRCRELEHAENTVVAYWMRYCSDALSKHDWEILAKIHNGGPQGPQREKTAYYWSKVSRYLEQIHVARPWTLEEPSSFKYSSYTNLGTKLDTKVKHGLKISAAERQKPIVSKHKKSRRVPLTDISSTVNAHWEETCIQGSIVRTIEERITIGDLNIQHLGQGYTCLESDAIKQKPDSPKNPIIADDDLPKGSSAEECEDFQSGRDRSGSPIDGIVVAPEDIGRWNESEEARRSSQEYWRSPESFGPKLQEGSLDMLYSTELSEQKEEEILTELAQLLPVGLSRVDDNFEFPCTIPETEYSTPVLKARPEERIVDCANEYEAEASPDIQPKSYSELFDATEAQTEDNVEFPLSPDTENNLLSELADLFHLPHPVTPAVEEQKVDDNVETAANLNLADFLLEISDPSASVEYVKALFSCEDVLLAKLCKTSKTEESTGSSKPPASQAPTEESRIAGTATRCPATNHLTSSLKKLCAVWEEQDVDLLTRSLRFKMINSNKPSESPKSEAACISWEVHALQNIHKNAKAKKAAKDLIQQQRDMMYVNIGAYASKSERHQLYSTWGVRRLKTGRLKKIVYELLWKDPKRYQESAELVSLYL